MKKIFIYISIVASLVGCNNDLETEGLSRITYYPTFELTGGDLVLYNVGETYTEPGIKVTEGGQAIDFTTSGSVDTSTPGFYQISYAAKNKDGFEGSAIRTVVVLEENLPELDIEGSWTSNTNAFSGASIGQTMTITKVADGVYEATDSYAHPDVEIPVRFLINADGRATMEEIPNSPFGAPYIGRFTFDVAQGEQVEYPDGKKEASPVAADLVMAVIIVDQPNTYRLKTWVKD